MRARADPAPVPEVRGPSRARQPAERTPGAAFLLSDPPTPCLRTQGFSPGTFPRHWPGTFQNSRSPVGVWETVRLLAGGLWGVGSRRGCGLQPGCDLEPRVTF